MSRFLTLFILTMVLYSCAKKQVLTPSKYLKIEYQKPIPIVGDDSVRLLMKKHKIEAASISYVKSYKRYEHHSYLLSESANYKVDSTSIFHASDIAKTVSAVALMQLVENTPLTLEKDMRPFINKLGIVNEYPDSYLALRNIVKHRGGFNVSRIAGFKKGEVLPTLDQMIKGEKPSKNPQLKVIYQPYKEHNHSDGGYLIIQKQIESQSDQSYQEYCDQNIFQLLKMKSSSFIFPKNEEKLILGVQGNGKKIEGGYKVYPAAAVNGLWSSSSDLSRLLHSLLWNFEERPRLATSNYLIYMTGNQLGINYDLESGTIYYNGVSEGYTAHFSGSIINKNGIVVMCNSENGGSFIDELYSIINRTTD